jgi:antitoxin component YwqK of YwqJK toxin-antitoxin module
MFSTLVLYKGTPYTGYLVFNQHPNGHIQAEVEYHSGSHIGWENEYHEAGILIYSRFFVGPATQEVDEYDDKGNLIDHYKL